MSSPTDGPAPGERDYRDAVPFPDAIAVHPIARVECAFTERHGTPRQPGLRGAKEVGDGAGRVVLLDDLDPSALTDLERFDRIWLVSWMHLNGPRRKPLVRPPRGGPKRGVFATRAPHRPNPIALSCVELLRVEGRVLHVRGLDLIDGTPILDIKPYIPDFDAFPGAARGWLSTPPSEGPV